jgi:hypothetical protein
VRKGADADTRRDAKFMTDQRKRSGDDGEYLLRHGRRILAIVHCEQNHYKFVASQASDCIALAHTAPESDRDFAKQLISCLMPQRVVDLFEAVEVEKSDCELPIIATRFADALSEELAEHTPIGKSCETVVIGEVLNTLRKL